MIYTTSEFGFIPGSWGGRWGEEVQYSNGANPAAVVPHSRFRLRDSCEISVMEHPQRSTKLNFLKSNLQEVTSC